MRITYDRDANAVYMHLTSERLEPGRDSMPCEPPNGSEGWVVLDWKEGKIVGLEVLEASERLHPDLLAEADDITR